MPQTSDARWRAFATAYVVAAIHADNSTDQTRARWKAVERAHMRAMVASATVPVLRRGA